MTDRPCSADEAVARALSLVDKGGEYTNGCGDYYPIGGLDLPWTRNKRGQLACDCSRFAICWCYKLRGARSGFNKGPWASVADHVNPNSAIEDADHKQELFERVLTPFPGALIMYPTFSLKGDDGDWLRNDDGTIKQWIGHVKIVTGISRCIEWDHDHPDWSLLDTAECMGPDGRRPGVVAGTGASLVDHDRRWPKSEHRTVMLRMRP